MATLYNQYTHKNNAWQLIGTGVDAVTYSVSASGQTVTLTGSDSSTSSATVALESITNADIDNIAVW